MMEIKPALALQGPQLSAIRSAEPAAVTQAITRLLAYVAGMFNFAANKNLSTVQVSMLANEIATDYWHLKFDEVVYVLRQGAKGKYHTFDRLDSGVIHGWFTEYQAERNEVLASVTHNENVAFKKQQELDNANAVAFLHGAEQMEAQQANMQRAYLRLSMSANTSEDLQKGIGYYTKHAHLPDAALKVAVAEQLLDERRLQAAAELARTEEARVKARVLLQQMEARDTPVPDLENQAVAYYAAQRGIPKLSDIVKPEPAPMKIVRNEDTNAA